MRIVEAFTAGKFADLPSEDAYVATADVVVVVDGATTSHTFVASDEASPGRRAAEAICRYVEHSLRPEMTALEAVRGMTNAVARLGIAGRERSSFDDWPTASFILYNNVRREVWAVGDCQMLTVAGSADAATAVVCRRAFDKEIDRVMASWRGAVDRSLMTRGVVSAEALRRSDVGRAVIEPFIARQLSYQNLDSDHRLAYGVVDGTPVPRRFVSVIPIGSEVSRLVLATDGYPQLMPTLAASEAALARLLVDDPLCLYANLGTKGIKPGARSFDDRTFVSLAL